METNANLPEDRSYFKPVASILILGIVINLAAVNYVLYRQQTSTVIPSASPLPTQVTMSQANCDEQCVRRLVTEATASIKLAPRASNAVATTVATTAPKASLTPAPRVKELFVSLGSGATAAGDWTFIETPVITVSRSSYPALSAAYFEATLSIPSTNGIAYARLFNVTDNLPLAYSDVSTTNSSPHLVTSLPISLDGIKSYRVQLKSSQMKDVLLSQSRIKVVIN